MAPEPRNRTLLRFPWQALNARNLTNDPNFGKTCSRYKGKKMMAFGRKRELLGDLTTWNRRQERAAGGERRPAREDVALIQFFWWL